MLWRCAVLEFEDAVAAETDAATLAGAVDAAVLDVEIAQVDEAAGRRGDREHRRMRASAAEQGVGGVGRGLRAIGVTAFDGQLQWGIDGERSRRVGERAAHADEARRARTVRGIDGRLGGAVRAGGVAADGVDRGLRAAANKVASTRPMRRRDGAFMASFRLARVEMERSGVENRVRRMGILPLDGVAKSFVVRGACRVGVVQMSSVA
jgi:hypothetical protein